MHEKGPDRRMLILDHPLTPFVFRAAGIEDQIRKRLVAMETASAEDAGRMRAEILGDFLPALYVLRKEHFAHEPKIDDGLRVLEAAIRSDESLKHIWDAFSAFADAPGDNFGTWAI